MPRRVVLASSSRYRAEMLAGAGIDATIDPPEVDEAPWQRRISELGPERLALELAAAKAASVAPRHPDAVVLAADQVGVVDGPDGAILLTKQPTRAGAVAQLCTMAGTSHRLVNGLVVLDTSTGRRVDGIDVQQVTMRRFGVAEAESYVDRFEPWDSSGSYRLEDQERMAPLEPFVAAVRGEHDSGVLGLPLPLLRRLLAQLEAGSGRDG